MNYIRIFETDTAHEMAMKIWEQFEVNQSCTLDEDRGEVVLTLLKAFFQYQCCDDKGKELLERDYYTVGGFKAHKAFKYRKKEGKMVIWRIQ